MHSLTQTCRKGAPGAGFGHRGRGHEQSGWPMWLEPSEQKEPWGGDEVREVTGGGKGREIDHLRPVDHCEDFTAMSRADGDDILWGRWIVTDQKVNIHHIDADRCCGD